MILRFCVQTIKQPTNCGCCSLNNASLWIVIYRFCFLNNEIMPDNNFTVYLLLAIDCFPATLFQDAHTDMGKQSFTEIL